MDRNGARGSFFAWGGPDRWSAPMSPLRVAFFVNWFPVASEAFIINAAAALIEAGCVVDIYALSGAAPPMQERHALLDAFRLEERFVNATAPEEGRLAQAPAALARAVGQRGLAGLSGFNIAAHRRRAMTLAPLYESAAFRDGGRYDVLHVQFSTLAWIVLRHRRAGALSGAVVVHFRGYDISQRVLQAGPGLHAEAFAGAEWFVANCAFFRDRIVSLGCDPARASIVPSGVRPERFEFRPRKGPAGPGVRLLGVGRLVEKKGFSDAVAAVGLLRAQGVDARLRLIGEGRLRSALEAQIAALGLQDVVTLLGERAQETIAAELDACDIFLAPCVTAADGDQDAPVNVLKEAMLAGAPVISTRHGGIPELVAHGETGLLTPERDPTAIAAAVMEYLAAPDRWMPMTTAARAFVEKNYSTEASMSALFEAYTKAISVHSVRRS